MNMRRRPLTFYVDADNFEFYRSLPVNQRSDMINNAIRIHREVMTDFAGTIARMEQRIVALESSKRCELA